MAQGVCEMQASVRRKILYFQIHMTDGALERQEVSRRNVASEAVKPRLSATLLCVLAPFSECQIVLFPDVPDQLAQIQCVVQPRE